MQYITDMRYNTSMTSFNLKHHLKTNESLIISFSVLLIIIIGLATYAYIIQNNLSKRIDTISANIIDLNTRLSSTTGELQNSIQQTSATLSNSLSATQQNVQQQLGGVQSQVGNLSGTLNTLQKLAQTDPELLKKYSKVYFLNENYVPAQLSEIPLAYQYSNNKQLLIHTNVLPHLEDMINAASSSGIQLYAFSAYRSFAEQRALKTEYRITYGAGTANSFSADQGYSEHQLGTALDMITSGLGGVLDGFDNTNAYTWMQNNAYRYGFELSYPKNNGYYVYEPWHWRFVGIKLANYLHSNNLNFYDLDQRTIDSYLVNIWDPS